MTSIPVGTCRISSNTLKRHYLKNKRLFIDFLLHFSNVLQIYNILKIKDEYTSLIISKVIISARGVYLNV